MSDMMSYSHHPNFISEEEVAHLMKMVRARNLWLYNNPNGDVGAWLPEREGIFDLKLERIIIHSRLEMGMEPVADGDVIFLKYPFGGYVKPHVDKHTHGKHLRCGILLQDAYKGGILYVDGEPVRMKEGDAVIYRADEVIHSVSKVQEGERYFLTIGTVFE